MYSSIEEGEPLAAPRPAPASARRRRRVVFLALGACVVVGAAVASRVTSQFRVDQVRELVFPYIGEREPPIACPLCTQNCDNCNHCPKCKFNCEYCFYSPTCEWNCVGYQGCPSSEGGCTPACEGCTSNCSPMSLTEDDYRKCGKT